MTCKTKQPSGPFNFDTWKNNVFYTAVTVNLHDFAESALTL